VLIILGLCLAALAVIGLGLLIVRDALHGDSEAIMLVMSGLAGCFGLAALTYQFLGGMPMLHP
jgi:hypothetical protein